jgi:hypothetical protein
MGPVSFLPIFDDVMLQLLLAYWCGEALSRIPVHPHPHPHLTNKNLAD